MRKGICLLILLIIILLCAVACGSAPSRRSADPSLADTPPLQGRFYRYDGENLQKDDSEYFLFTIDHEQLYWAWSYQGSNYDPGGLIKVLYQDDGQGYLFTVRMINSNKTLEAVIPVGEQTYIIIDSKMYVHESCLHSVTFYLDSSNAWTATVMHGKKISDLKLKQELQSREIEPSSISGWYEDADFSQEFLIGNTIVQSQVIYARRDGYFQGATCGVSLEQEGGTGGTTFIVATLGFALPVATAPTREGYSFIGYFDFVPGGKKYYSNDMSSVANWDKEQTSFALYAQWEPKSSIIEFDVMGGSGYTPDINVTYDEDMIDVECIPSKHGYDFAGYSDLIDGGTKYYDEKGKSIKKWDKDIEICVLYAQWRPKESSVFLDNNGGDDTAVYITMAFGQDAPRLQVIPTRTGYDFAGYSDMGEDGAKYYDADGFCIRIWDKEDSSSTLYAQWVLKTTTIAFNTNGGVGGPVSVVATYNKAMPAIEFAPTRPYHKFIGFFDLPIGGKRYYDKDLAGLRLWDREERNVFLYAQWEALPQQLATPTNLQISKTAITWDAVENATGYYIEIYKDADGLMVGIIEKYEYINNGSSTIFLVQNLPQFTHSIKVKAIGNGGLYLDSEWSSQLLYKPSAEIPIM